jgi:ribosomal-protein-alanine N-acetyltransferase
MVASLNKHYTVRLMRHEDVPQVTEIDREAFPTQWPPPSFSKELNNKLAHYLVICEERGGGQTKFQPPSVLSAKNQGLLSGLRRLLGRREPSPRSGTDQVDYLVGMVGFWLMFDEVHIITIAVRQSHRRRGIGEQLLISAIDLAVQLQAQVVTLEVRPSNTSAHALYEKYGFRQEGIRRRYYSDNNEDALIMTTNRLSSPSFKEQFQRLRIEHNIRWGRDFSNS